jgi:hypothetical protein
VHPRFRTLTTGFLSKDLVSDLQRRVFFLGTSFQVCLKVWTEYWESRFKCFIEDFGHLDSGPRRFWRPRSFQDLVLFLLPQTNGQTPCLLLYIGWFGKNTILCVFGGTLPKCNNLWGILENGNARTWEHFVFLEMLGIGLFSLFFGLLILSVYPSDTHQASHEKNLITNFYLCKHPLASPHMGQYSGNAIGLGCYPTLANKTKKAFHMCQL